MRPLPGPDDSADIAPVTEEHQPDKAAREREAAQRDRNQADEQREVAENE